MAAPHDCRLGLAGWQAVQGWPLSALDTLQGRQGPQSTSPAHRLLGCSLTSHRAKPLAASTPERVLGKEAGRGARAPLGTAQAAASQAGHAQQQAKFGSLTPSTTRIAMNPASYYALLHCKCPT